MNSLLADHCDQPADDIFVRDLVRGSGTSFFWAMRLLEPQRRRAMYAVYAFCREVDDIADADAALSWKRTELDRWRGEIDRLFAGTPTRPTTRAILPAIARFGLGRHDFDAIVDGMAMDAGDPMLAPDRATLLLYCDRVAGAVGRLCVCVFGENNPQGIAVANHLGQALQLTNILRDLDEDAAAGRLYLPRELLAAAGIPITTPEAVLAHRDIDGVCRQVAAWADAAFERAARAMAACDRGAMRPARIMMNVYRCTFERLRARGWTAPRPAVGPGKPTKLWIALSAAVR